MKHLGQIQHQVNELTELLNEFLILSRMESVGIQFEPEETDVVALCEDIVASAQTSFPSHPFDLVGEGPFRAAQVDRKLFQQAVRNVVSNAAKYSPDGSPITLSVRCSDDELIVRVRDRGIGIPQEEQVRLFEPFFRASNVGDIEGTGLGLAIVQRAVEAHHGTIQVESEVGVGSEVKFIFPRFGLGKTG
jgi:signal transduction histidine kinase